MPFFNRFQKKQAPGSKAPEYLIVGLGNPGRQYEFSRHNAGFLCVDLLAQRQDLKLDRLKFKSLCRELTISGHRCLIMKPQTFMNNSGEAVREAAQFYKIPPERVILIFDDASLPLGKLRIRRKGSDGGQKGVRSIIYLMNSDEFPRVKLGIGAKPHPDWDMADWVLSQFTKAELQTLRGVCDEACEALELLVNEEFDRAMERFN